MIAAKDARLNSKAKEQILLLFPNIPRDLISDILGHTLKKRSGRVGRTATIPFEDSINLAVRAFIRHRLTDYDKLLRDGMAQKSAREKIGGKSDKIAAEWKGSESGRRLLKKGETKLQKSMVEGKGKEKGSDTCVEVIDLTSD